MPIITGGDPPNRRNKTRKGNPIRAQKAAEMELRRALQNLNSEIKLATEAVSAQISGGATPAQVASFIERRLKQANAQYDAAADRLAQVFVGKLSTDNKARIEAMLQNTLGLEMVKVLDTPALKKELEIAMADNARLIKSIPEVHFQKVTQAVMDNYRGIPFTEGSLSNRLKKIGRLTDNRAKFLARDQTQKLVTGLNSIRQKEAGIEEYIWRNQGDRRVVGNPSGLYPKGSPQHENHWQREGKVFKWDKPPSDGHPGQAIGCRCFAEPVINFDKIDENAIKL